MSNESEQKGIEIPAEVMSVLERNNVTLGQRLEKGGYATVLKATIDGKEAACKIINAAETSSEYRNRFLPRELFALQKLKHPNIIEVFKIIKVKNFFFIFLEYADGGDFLKMLKKGPVGEDKARMLFKQLVKGLKYIHSKGIAHRDIKCENCLLNQDQTVAKLTDFGFARLCFDPDSGRRVLAITHCGSENYAAPEVLGKESSYDAMRSDCWSMGVILFALVEARMPFHSVGINTKRILDRQRKSEYSYRRDQSEGVKNLISRLLDPDKTTRWTMSEVADDDWLNGRSGESGSEEEETKK